MVDNTTDKVNRYSRINSETPYDVIFDETTQYYHNDKWQVKRALVATFEYDVTIIPQEKGLKSTAHLL